MLVYTNWNQVLFQDVCDIFVSSIFLKLKLQNSNILNWSVESWNGRPDEMFLWNCFDIFWFILLSGFGESRDRKEYPRETKPNIFETDPRKFT